MQISKSIQLDEEWKELILEALAAGITLKEIRIFLNTWSPALIV
ncbi:MULTISPECIES: anti-repressor SinI family protein [Bacillus]|nr:MULTISPECIES: anti-repressor SinI family protein [Bacillus]MED1095674.1 anti-repressor SinI family protein [Bacillus capparidis]